MCERLFIRLGYNFNEIFSSMSLISFYPSRKFFLLLDACIVGFESENRISSIFQLKNRIEMGIKIAYQSYLLNPWKLEFCV